MYSSLKGRVPTPSLVVVSILVEAVVVPLVFVQMTEEAEAEAALTAMFV